MNPTGPDGKILLCAVCGSYRHMLAACPDSSENMATMSSVNTIIMMRVKHKKTFYDPQAAIKVA